MRATTLFSVNRFPALPAILAIAAATLLIGCHEKASKPKVEEPVPPKNPQEVLDALTSSWVHFDYDTYQSLLSDDFLFVFAPQDTGGIQHYPGTWGRADDLLSASHLFSKTLPNVDGYIAQSAMLTFVRGPEIPNDMGTWTRVVLSQIFLTVRTRHKDTGDPLDYLIEGDQAYLWFVQEGAACKIIRWEDKPITVGLATRVTTWGRVKRSYR